MAARYVMIAPPECAKCRTRPRAPTSRKARRRCAARPFAMTRSPGLVKSSRPARDASENQLPEDGL